MLQELLSLTLPLSPCANYVRIMCEASLRGDEASTPFRSVQRRVEESRVDDFVSPNRAVYHRKATPDSAGNLPQ